MEHPSSSLVSTLPCRHDVPWLRSVLPKLPLLPSLGSRPSPLCTSRSQEGGALWRYFTVYVYNAGTVYKCTCPLMVLIKTLAKVHFKLVNTITCTCTLYYKIRITSQKVIMCIHVHVYTCMYAKWHDEKGQKHALITFDLRWAGRFTGKTWPWAVNIPLSSSYSNHNEYYVYDTVKTLYMYMYMYTSFSCCTIFNSELPCLFAGSSLRTVSKSSW